MAATVAHDGSYSAHIYNITLDVAGGETIAHGLGACPSFISAFVKGIAGNTSLQGTIKVISYSNTYISVANTGGQILDGEMFLLNLHSWIK